jgi:hypothetical protein
MPRNWTHSIPCLDLLFMFAGCVLRFCALASIHNFEISSALPPTLCWHTPILTTTVDRYLALAGKMVDQEPALNHSVSYQSFGTACGANEVMKRKGHPQKR